MCCYTADNRQYSNQIASGRFTSWQSSPLLRASPETPNELEDRNEQ